MMVWLARISETFRLQLIRISAAPQIGRDGQDGRMQAEIIMAFYGLKRFVVSTSYVSGIRSRLGRPGRNRFVLLLPSHYFRTRIDKIVSLNLLYTAYIGDGPTY
jgi:hypothetical protein